MFNFCVKSCCPLFLNTFNIRYFDSALCKLHGLHYIFQKVERPEECLYSKACICYFLSTGRRLTRPCFRDSTENEGSPKMFVMARSCHQNILFGRKEILFAIYFIYRCKPHPKKSKEKKQKNRKIVAFQKNTTTTTDQK